MLANPNDPDEAMGAEPGQNPVASLESRVKKALADAQADFKQFTKND